MGIAALVAACQPCAEFQALDGTTLPPANVLVSFGVQQCDGEPMPPLTSADFIIEENGDLVSEFESHQTILPTGMAFELQAVLLLDMSGSIINSGNLPPLIEAADQLVDRIAGAQQMAVYLFDGREELIPLVDFTADATALHEGIRSLDRYEPVDPSTNLNGAVLAGLQILDEREAVAAEGSIFAGSLIVFTDGTDQAGRVPDGAAVGAAGETDHSMFSIGLGGEIDEEYLSNVGKDGFERAENSDEVALAFARIADRIEQIAQGFYVVAYCSPKRAGRHELSLGVRGYSGRLYFSFDASEFGPGCDAETISSLCGDRECGTVLGMECGSCGDTRACNADGRCYDPCVGRLCGTVEGVECGGPCGAGLACSDEGMCYDPCIGRSCGTVGGVTCGARCDPGMACNGGGSCYDPCVGRVCGTTAGVMCGSDCASGQLCNSDGRCERAYAGRLYNSFDGSCSSSGITVDFTLDDALVESDVPPGSNVTIALPAGTYTFGARNSSTGRAVVGCDSDLRVSVDGFWYTCGCSDGTRPRS